MHSNTEKSVSVEIEKGEKKIIIIVEREKLHRSVLNDNTFDWRNAHLQKKITTISLLLLSIHIL